MNESSVRQIDHVQLRASQEKDATFKLGQRYPILNASFAPISNSPAIVSSLAIVENYRDFVRSFSLCWLELYPPGDLVVLRNLRNATCVV